MDAALSELAKKQVYFGTSSWKYEGWQGLIYKKPYTSKKQFNDTCLEEYAQQYPVVGVDHTYYNWPQEKAFEKYVEQTPANFKFVLKATEHTTVFKYPRLPRYGKVAGKANAGFLNPTDFKQHFLGPLAPFQDRLGPIMLEFSQFHAGMLENGREFLDRLDQFFTGLGDTANFRFAIELRNANWLQPAYFTFLKKFQIGHVYNSWTKMPSIKDQLHSSDNYALPFYVSRLLLRPGTQYEDAVERFAPYREVQEEQVEGRTDAGALIRRAMKEKVSVYVLVNNRFEGCAPHTINAIAQSVLSPAV